MKQAESKAVKKRVTEEIMKALQKPHLASTFTVTRVDDRSLLLKVPAEYGPSYFQIVVKEMI